MRCGDHAMSIVIAEPPDVIEEEVKKYMKILEQVKKGERESEPQKTTKITLPLSLYHELERQAKEIGVSVSQFIRIAIARTLAELNLVRIIKPEESTTIKQQLKEIAEKLEKLEKKMNRIDKKVKELGKEIEVYKKAADLVGLLSS